LKGICVIVDRDSRPEHIHVVQKHSTSQDLMGIGYDFKDLTTDCFSKMTASIEREKATMIAGTINYVREHELRRRNRDARGRR